MPFLKYTFSDTNYQFKLCVVEFMDNFYVLPSTYDNLKMPAMKRAHEKNSLFCNRKNIYHL